MQGRSKVDQRVVILVIHNLLSCLSVCLWQFWRWKKKKKSCTESCARDCTLGLPNIHGRFANLMLVTEQIRIVGNSKLKVGEVSTRRLSETRGSPLGNLDRLRCSSPRRNCSKWVSLGVTVHKVTKYALKWLADICDQFSGSTSISEPITSQRYLNNASLRKKYVFFFRGKYNKPRVTDKLPAVHWCPRRHLM